MSRLCFTAFVLAVALSGIAGSLAYACNCMPAPPPKTALKEASAVFSGTVTRISKAKGYTLVRFDVVRVWKGVAQPFVNVTTAKSEAACAFTFAQNQTYLVYAYRYKGQRYLSTNLCTRTGLLSQSGEDLTAIGRGKSLVFLTQQWNLKQAQAKSAKTLLRK